MVGKWGKKLKDLDDLLKESKVAKATVWCLDAIRKLAEEEALAEAQELAQATLGEEERKVKKKKLQVKFTKLMPGSRQGIHTLTTDGVNFLTDEKEIERELANYWEKSVRPAQT